ncbi:MAG: alternative ribosome rescue aminoacyl-tRNA hydrolase ArfB [Desulfobacterales bacterium]|jgi:ribosome-associated protein
MIQVNEHIVLDENEIQEEFVRSSGPGGQNVNRVATAVQLRFDIANSASLPEDVRRRLLRLGGSRVTRDGILIIDARRFRTQEQNRKDARERLIGLVKRAAEKPKPRRRTRPTAASRRKRLEEKRRRSRIKQGRQSVDPAKGSG